MAAEPHAELCAALRTLFAHHRPERWADEPWAWEHRTERRGLVLWVHQRTYANPRLAGTTTNGAVVVLDQLSTDAVHVLTESEAFARVHHLVIVCRKASIRAELNLHAQREHRSQWWWETLFRNEFTPLRVLCQVPRHVVVVDPTERAQWLQQFQTQATTAHLPVLLVRKDPIARILGVRPLDLVLVYMPDAVHGETVQLRLGTLE